MTHPAFSPSNVVVITGGASGIGLAAAKRFAAMGLKVAIADLGGEKLDKANALVAEQTNPENVIAVATDVTSIDHLQHLQQTVEKEFGGVDILMNNAGIQPGSSIFNTDNWARIIDVNLFGITYCLTQECSQRTMPLPHSDVLDCLTGCSRDLASADSGIAQ